MADAHVPFDDYVTGDLPDVSVVSGELATHRVVLSNPVEDGTHGTGPLLPFVVRFIEQFNVTRGSTRGARVVLRGKVPMTPAEERSLRWQAIAWRTLLWAALIGLVVVAWAAAPWSPGVAALVGAVLVLAAFGLQRTRSAWPKGSIDDPHEWVTVSGVHGSFVAAAAERFGRPPAGE